MCAIYTISALLLLTGESLFGDAACCFPGPGGSLSLGSSAELSQAESGQHFQNEAEQISSCSLPGVGGGWGVVGHPSICFGPPHLFLRWDGVQRSPEGCNIITWPIWQEESTLRWLWVG